MSLLILRAWSHCLAGFSHDIVRLYRYCNKRTINSYSLSCKMSRQLSVRNFLPLVITVSSVAVLCGFSLQNQIKTVMRSCLSEAKAQNSSICSNLPWWVWLRTCEHPVEVHADQEKGLSSDQATSVQLFSCKYVHLLIVIFKFCKIALFIFACFGTMAAVFLMASAVTAGKKLSRPIHLLCYHTVCLLLPLRNL